MSRYIIYTNNLPPPPTLEKYYTGSRRFRKMVMTKVEKKEILVKIGKIPCLKIYIPKDSNKFMHSYFSTNIGLC